MLVQTGSWFPTDSLLTMLSRCLGCESLALIHPSRIVTPSMQETPLLSACQIKESNILTKYKETLVLCYFHSHVYSGNQLNCDASSWMHRETVSCVLAYFLIFQPPLTLLYRREVIITSGPCQYRLFSSCALLRYEHALIASFHIFTALGIRCPDVWIPVALMQRLWNMLPVTEVQSLTLTFHHHQESGS